MKQRSLRNSLRTRVLVPLGIFLAMMFAALIYASHTEENSHNIAETEQAFHAVQQHYDTALATHSRQLSASLSFIVNDPALTRALRARDRDMLRQLATPLFQRLHAEQQITHFHFIAPDRTSLLRVHAPSRHGDIIQPRTAPNAVNGGKPATNMELGPLGTFTLRAAVPWRANGELIGYVELGEDIEPILEQIKTLSNVDLFIAVDKRFLSQSARLPNWSQFAAYVVTFGTSPEILPALAGAFSKAALPSGISGEISHDGRLLRTTFIPLTESSGRKVGSLLLARDVTTNFDKGDQNVAIAASILLVGGSAMLVFFYLLLGRVGRKQESARLALIRNAEHRATEQVRHIQDLEQEHAALREIQEKLQASEKRLEEAQRIAHLGNWEWDIPSGSLFWSEEIYRIFGRSPNNFTPTFDAFLNLVHPADREQVQHGVNQALYKNQPYHLDHRVILPDGTVRTVHERGEISYDEHGNPVRMAGTVQDITTRKMTEEQLNYLAYFDSLTGLPNRTLFADRLNQDLIEAKRHERVVAVMLLDIDHFKNINETMGHESGDQLLKRVADRLSQCTRRGDTIARLGGDEFAIILADVAHADDVAVIAQKMMAIFEPSFPVSDSEGFLTCSVGITLFPTDGITVDMLLQNADSAMYSAKEQGRNNYQFYAPEMTAFARHRFALEAGLRHALEKNELLLHYQPQISATSGRIIGVEALVRWHRPEEGLVPPIKFIPLAEETGLIVPIGEWVLHTACAQLKAWSEAGLTGLRMGVNLSSRQFKKNNLVHTVMQVIAETRINPSQLDLEITESLLVDSPAIFDELFALKALGVSISIDDFGTGYSSLSYLNRFPIDTLKIDQSFVRDITKGDGNAALVRAIIAMSRSLDLSVIAEGVETLEHADFLKLEGCDEMQGYYFARPMPADMVTEFIRKFNG